MPWPFTKEQHDSMVGWLISVLPDGLACCSCKRALPIDHTLGIVIKNSDTAEIEVRCPHCTHGMIYHPEPEIVRGY